MIRPFMSANEKIVVEDLENSDLSYEFDIMNDYDNSLNLARDFINSLDVKSWYHSSSINFADEYDVDQSILDTFLNSIL